MENILLTTAAVITLALIILIPILLRRVVLTNEVHIVQSSRSTTSYGKDMDSGNTYYEWPHWVPVIGVTKIVLPVSVFDLSLEAYEAYDKERVPFVVDVTAFFRISDSNVAAQRISDFRELEQQLKVITQGAVRTVLASHEINDIMLKRSEFGAKFTEEVAEQLRSWGVESVKNIELMDIRDASGESVVHNIMNKRKSFIEMESRKEVADNTKKAEVAEIEAKKETELRNQIANQEVGQRKALTAKEIGVAEQQAIQEIKEQERTTREREMSVLRVQEVKEAEIQKDKQIVQADEQKQTSIIIAEGHKQKSIVEAEGVKQETILKAEADLQSQQLGAQGIQAEGSAKAEAEKLMQLAPIEAQITLAKEIGENDSYQNYLLTIRKIEADEAVGTEQAKALTEADLKVIANGGDVVGGVGKISDILSTKGGTSAAGMLEGLSQSEPGKALINKFLKGNGDSDK